MNQSKKYAVLLHNFIHSIATFLFEIQISALNTLSLLSSLREKIKKFHNHKRNGWSYGLVLILFLFSECEVMIESIKMSFNEWIK